MKIVHHGNGYEVRNVETEKFKCDACGCEFEAEPHEYYVDYCGADWSSDNITLRSFNLRMRANDYLVCSCPECHSIIKKVRTREQVIRPYTYAAEIGVKVPKEEAGFNLDTAEAIKPEGMSSTGENK